MHIVHLGQGGPDHPCGEGGGKEKAGEEEDGGADEGGEEGAVDGLPPGTWLGKERPMPWTVEENNIKYFTKHTLYLFCLKINLKFLCVSFRIKCSAKYVDGRSDIKETQV